MSDKIKHLLIPKEFRVYCRPTKLPGKNMLLTSKPSETGCANCLTQFRAKTTGKTQPFRKSHTANWNPKNYEQWSEPVLPENL